MVKSERAGLETGDDGPSDRVSVERKLWGLARGIKYSSGRAHACGSPPMLPLAASHHVPNATVVCGETRHQRLPELHYAKVHLLPSNAV